MTDTGFIEDVTIRLNEPEIWFVAPKSSTILSRLGLVLIAVARYILTGKTRIRWADRVRKTPLPMVPVAIREEQADGTIKIEPRTPGWLLAQILASPNLTFAPLAEPLPAHDKLVNGK